MYRVYTALVTPFVDYKIDFESLHKLIDKVNNSKCKGVVALGSTGENHLLDDKQKLAVLKFVAKHSTKTVIAGVSSPSTNTCANLAKKYRQAGANALLMTPPYFVCCNGKGLLKHFENVQKATKLPIILYNVPHRTGFDVDVDTVSKISDVCNLLGVKECNDNSAKIAKYRHENIRLFCGNDTAISKFGQFGYLDTISVCANLCPNLTAVGGDVFDQFASLCAKSNPSVIKYALYCAKLIDSPQVALPLTTPSKLIKRKVREFVYQNRENMQ